MGLTSASTGQAALDKGISIERTSENDIVVALAGNPNVGKSSVFNELTGLNQHTGNWPGKTVATAQGHYFYKSRNFIMVDLPGTYSLMAHSQEEEVARDFICSPNPDVTVVVCDGSCLERNLNLVLQALEITSNVVVCVNLMDETEKKKIKINFELLSKMLGVPVVPTSARSGYGLDKLTEQIYQLANTPNKSAIKVRYDSEIENALLCIYPNLPQSIPFSKRWLSLRILEQNSDFEKYTDEYLKNIEIPHIENVSDKIVSSIVITAEKLASRTVSINENANKSDRMLDKIVTSKRFGIPIMILLLFFILWLTVTGANYPSQWLSDILFKAEEYLLKFCIYIGIPDFIYEPLVHGSYRVLAWVVSVMLPPMAIFFPLFTILEDFGYLPRVAFNLDKYFKKACTCGKQCLTMM